MNKFINNLNMETKCPSSSGTDSNNQENLNINGKRTKNIPKIESVASKGKVEKKKTKSQLRLLNETPEQREFRLQRQREYKQSRTPEQIKASKLKNALYTKRYREEKLNVAQTPEEREALLQERKDYSRNYREKLKSLAKTPEEKEALRMKIVNEKRRSVAKLQKLPDRDYMGKLCGTPEEIEARLKKRRKSRKNEEEISLLTLKKRMKATEYMRTYRQKRAMKAIGQETVPSSSSTKNRMKQQITSNFPFVTDEIKIEKEVLQEMTFPSLQNANSISYNLQSDATQSLSSCSWFEPSVDSFTSYGTINNATNCCRSFNDLSPSLPENFPNIINHSTKIERRKTKVEESLNYMRELIDATAKGDKFAVFGKHIAQKLRFNKMDVEEVNYAKLLIDDVLQSLELGFYSSETKIMKVEKMY